MCLHNFSFRRLSVAACMVIALLSLQPGQAASRSGLTQFEARCTDVGIVIHFTYFEDPLEPTGHPEWTQYALFAFNPDVPLPACGSGSNGGVLEYIPRSGATDDITYVYPHQEWISNRNIYFSVEPRDAAYRIIYGIFAAGDYSGCPIATTPSVVGTIVDLGWAVRTEACGDCGGYVLVKEPGASQLRPYAGTGQVVLLYGEETCTPAWEGGVGCSIELHHFELLADCPVRPVPTRAQTWGQLKTRYR